MNELKELRKELKDKGNREKAKILSGFFKTGKGEYGEGDIFLGITVPESRKLAKKYLGLSLIELQELLNSEIHEERLIALHILVYNFEKSPEKRKEIFNFYMENTKNINNWDLVDTSAPRVVGGYLFQFQDKGRKLLDNLSVSNNLWERRISIISTLYFIRNNDFESTLRICERLLEDKHDLIQKATGWMLREIGKKDLEVLECFLRKNYKIMPRTMLRYAIEKFPEEIRLNYLKGKI